MVHNAFASASAPASPTLFSATYSVSSVTLVHSRTARTPDASAHVTRRGVCGECAARGTKRRRREAVKRQAGRCHHTDTGAPEHQGVRAHSPPRPVLHPASASAPEQARFPLSRRTSRGGTPKNTSGSSGRLTPASAETEREGRGRAGRGQGRRQRATLRLHPHRSSIAPRPSTLVPPSALRILSGSGRVGAPDLRGFRASRPRTGTTRVPRGLTTAPAHRNHCISTGFIPGGSYS